MPAHIPNKYTAEPIELNVSDDVPTSEEINTLDVDEIDALWRVIRKLSDTHAMLVIQVLYDHKTLTFGELLKETGLMTNPLNHALTDLKRLNLVLESRDNKEYYITNYGYLILRMLWNLARISANEAGFVHP